MYGGTIGPQHAALLRGMLRAEREEQDRREAAAEAWVFQCAAAAPVYYESMQLARARAAVAEARVERAAEQARQERISAAEDYRCMLLATGAGRLRSISEVLAAARGWG